MPGEVSLTRRAERGASPLTRGVCDGRGHRSGRENGGGRGQGRGRGRGRGGEPAGLAHGIPPGVKGTASRARKRKEMELVLCSSHHET